MSPIIDVQRRFAPAGEIRPGRQVPVGGTTKSGKAKTRPEKLENWRFTSRNRRALEAVAALYGGTVTKWEDAPTADQWELLSNANEINVVLPPESVAFSQWMELWSGGGCKRRCDGVTEQLSDGPCLCDPDNQECKPTTRLSVMLASVPTTGLWKVVSTGHNAKAELAGAMDLAELLTKATGASILPAVLRLEHRKKITDGKTRQFVVPTLDYQVDMAALALGSTKPQQALGAGSFQPIPVAELPEAPNSSTAAQVASVNNPAPKPKRANAAEPLRSTGLKPRPVNSSVGSPSTGGSGSATSVSDSGADREPTPGSLPEGSPTASPAGREGGSEARQGVEAEAPQTADEAPAPGSFEGETGEIADSFTIIALRNQIAKLPVEAKAEVATEFRKRGLGSVRDGARRPLLMSQAEVAQDVVDAIEAEYK